MKTAIFTSFLLSACTPLASPSGAASTAPRVEVSPSARTGIRLVPAKDGGMTCLPAKDVQRLQAYLDRCVLLESP